eukprot:gene16436-19550_t
MVQKLVQQLPPQQTALQLINFAKGLIGKPYHYASKNPKRGFDCSGFVSYVFENFGFSVPRSSREFPDAGVPVSLQNAKGLFILLMAMKLNSSIPLRARRMA